MSSLSPLSPSDLVARGLVDFAATTVEFVAVTEAGRRWISQRAGFNYPEAIASVLVRKSLTGDWMAAAAAAGLVVGR